MFRFPATRKGILPLEWQPPTEKKMQSMGFGSAPREDCTQINEEWTLFRT